MARVSICWHWAPFVSSLLALIIIDSQINPLDAATCFDSGFNSTGCAAGTMLKNGQASITCATTTCVSSDCCQVFWTTEVVTAPFALRHGRSIVFLNKMYLVGGVASGYVILNSIYQTSDGVSWSAVTTSGTIFSVRYAHSLTVFNNMAILIGGGDPAKNDIWTSTTMTAWTNAGTVPFAARLYHDGFVLSGTMFVGTGYHSTATTGLNDLYSSTTGTTFTTAIASAAFPARLEGKFAVFHGKAWLIGGVNTVQLNDI